MYHVMWACRDVTRDDSSLCSRCVHLLIVVCNHMRLKNTGYFVCTLVIYNTHLRVISTIFLYFEYSLVLLLYIYIYILVYSSKLLMSCNAWRCLRFQVYTPRDISFNIVHSLRCTYMEMESPVMSHRQCVYIHR